MTVDEKVRKAFEEAATKPQGAGKPCGPLKVSPATVNLDETQIKWAIDAYVSAEGYAVGNVTLAFHPAGQIDRGTFSATVEVTPREERLKSCYE